MPTLTSRFEFIKPLVNDATDEDLWGGFLNDNFDMLDGTVGRVLITTDDTDVGFAQDKIVAGRGAETEVGNPASNETLIIHTTGVPVGGYQFVDTSLVGSEEPSNAGSIKWIKLTKDLMGAGDFNEGLLENQQEDVIDGRTVYSAEISVGAMAGQRVVLLNSTGAFLRPSETAGVFQADALQDHMHSNPNRNGDGSGGTGVGINSQSAEFTPFNPAQKISSGAGGTGVRIATETRPLNVSTTAYMRIA